MSWLTALVKAILDWITAEVKKDTKAGDADATPQSLKDKWRRRIEEQERKVKKNENGSDSSEQLINIRWMRINASCIRRYSI